jgi:hypothetical protein
VTADYDDDEEEDEDYAQATMLAKLEALKELGRPAGRDDEPCAPTISQ